MTTPDSRLPPPEMEPSTRTALVILACLVLAAVTSPWLPAPGGWIVVVLMIYVGLPLAFMVVSDLGALRQDRMLASELERLPASSEAPDGDWRIHFTPLALRHVARWRGWFPYLVASLVLMLACASVQAAWSPLAVVVLGVIGLGREFFLAINVLERLVPDVWRRLRPLEQARLRACLLLMALLFAAIAVGFVIAFYFVFFVNDEPWKLGHVAFAVVYGSLSWPASKAAWRSLRRAVRAVPADEPYVDGRDGRQPGKAADSDQV